MRDVQRLHWDSGLRRRFLHRQHFVIHRQGFITEEVEKSQCDFPIRVLPIFLPRDLRRLKRTIVLALQAPKTRFIFAHLGGMNFRFWNILAAARTAENLFANNIYFDISATVAMFADSPVEDEFVWTIRNVGVDHVLFGSDFPQYSLAKNLTALKQLGLTEEEEAAIRFENARKLLGLKAN